MSKVLIYVVVLVTMVGMKSLTWGFFGHKLINRHAIFSLPPEMIGFYKKHINLIVEKAVDPDRRRYAVEYEAARHYIDIDHYGKHAINEMPRMWFDAVERYSEDTLNAYGIVPWHIALMKNRLTEAFKGKEAAEIIKLSSEIGHYIADANVPLHTTENYNGQLTNQHGIHGFWESRLPELFSAEYNLLIGQAEYISSPQLAAWSAVENAHQSLDSVLQVEITLSMELPIDKKYSYEERGSGVVRVYSREFSKEYHEKLNGMVERRMKAAIKMVSDFWFTSWVDAGQPDLSGLEFQSKEKDETWLNLFRRRPHEN